MMNNNYKMKIYQFIIKTILLTSCTIVGGAIGLIGGSVLIKAFPVNKTEKKIKETKSSSNLDFDEHGEPSAEALKFTVKGMSEIIGGFFTVGNALVNAKLFNFKDKVSILLGASSGFGFGFYLCSYI